MPALPLRMTGGADACGGPKSSEKPASGGAGRGRFAADLGRSPPHYLVVAADNLRRRTRFEYVYFIEQGLASVLTTMANGSTIEVGMIGVEGMVGISALLGAERSSQQIIVQIEGAAFRTSAAACKAAFDRSPAIRGVVHRFTDAMLNLSAQTAACNRLHMAEQRCARWLLMSSDRIRSD